MMLEAYDTDVEILIRFDHEPTAPFSVLRQSPVVITTVLHQRIFDREFYSQSGQEIEPR
jgi:hypothetical protein